ncbi:MAG: c-type cytochrome [Planctomycetota bacterium]|jgi:mono/diheme cytochrome c family protein
MFCFIASVIGVFLASTNTEVEAQNTDAGKKVFDEKCKACHSIGGGKLVGPDLKGLKDRAPSAEWVVAFVKDPQGINDDYAKKMRKAHHNNESTKVMAPLGLTDKETTDVVNYLFGGNAVETKAVEVATGDDAIAMGKKYFTGQLSFENGGPACISCHTVSGLGAFGGGSLASSIGKKHQSLNKAWERNGQDAGLAAAIQNPQFEVMRDVFRGKSLTDEEASTITAFLKNVATEEEKENSNTGMMIVFVLMAFVGAGAFIFLFDRVWAKRFRDVRKPLVGE